MNGKVAGGSGPDRRQSAGGFTILELITVIAIMLLMMGATVTSFVGMRRGAELRSAVASVRGGMGVARQYAVTKRERVHVCFVGDSAFIITNAYGLIGETNYLPPGVRFALKPATPIVFAPSGGSGSARTHDIQLRERLGGQGYNITVYGLTGLLKVEETY